MAKREDVIRELTESAGLQQAVQATLADAIVQAAQTITDAFKAGNKLLLCGNGGSAADAQHLAAEMVGRFRMERPALPAIALTTDTSVLTALANDYGYDKVFSRQVEALGGAGDVLLAMTTSGVSPNIRDAIGTARDRGMAVIVLTGEKGTNPEGKAGLVLAVPSANPPRIQEAHITIGHIICRLVEEELFK